jgi:hypothetical protein
LGLRRPAAKIRRSPVAIDISRIAARSRSFSMPFSATLLFEPTVAYRSRPSRSAMMFFVQ